jgi:hypothetical protein
MNNNQRNKRNKRNSASAPARGSSGKRAQQQQLVSFAIRPKGARKNRTGRRVAMPEELGRRHRVAVVTTSFKSNALRQPRLRLQRLPTPNKPCPTHTNCDHKN